MGETLETITQSQPSFISDEIMFKILSSLPVKSIIRFKCVCKKWYELSGDSSFIAAHLKRSVEIVGYLDERFYERGNPFSADYYLSDDNFEEFHKLPFETEPHCNFEIVASVDGLVCIQKFHGLGSKTSVLLWNPANTESRTLPDHPGSLSFNYAIGFGLDPKNKDYKLVKMLMNPFEESNRVDVYSLRKDRWRSFEVECFSVLHSVGACVHGRLHWLAAKPPFDYFIVSFDLTDEKIVEIGVRHNKDFSPKSVSLISSGKSLTIHRRNNEKETEVWLMKKYGDSKSWSKLYSIPPHPMYECILSTLCIFLENGKVIMHCRRNCNLISYDPKNQVDDILPIEGCAGIIKYKESLVSIERGRSCSEP